MVDTQAAELAETVWNRMMSRAGTNVSPEPEWLFSKTGFSRNRSVRRASKVFQAKQHREHALELAVEMNFVAS